MTAKRNVEIFSAGCPVCQSAIDLVNSIACPACNITVLDMADPNVSTRAKTLNISSIPAIVVDGILAECCTGRGVDEKSLRAAGIGKRLI